MSKNLEEELPQFYMTETIPCAYLPGQEERKIFTNLCDDNAHSFNDKLTLAGFRRSQKIAYKPACKNCQACISIRVNIREFKFTTSFRRILNKNKHIIKKQTLPNATRTQFELFKLYLETRHQSGEMSNMTPIDYISMIENTDVNTHITEYINEKNQLIGCALIDPLSDGLSMVYSFFNPNMSKYSLGNFIILDQIKKCQEQELNYLYLGYWIKDCQTMTYKTRFQPLEYLTNQGWTASIQKP